MQFTFVSVIHTLLNFYKYMPFWHGPIFIPFGSSVCINETFCRLESKSGLHTTFSEPPPSTFISSSSIESSLFPFNRTVFLFTPMENSLQVTFYFRRSTLFEFANHESPLWFGPSFWQAAVSDVSVFATVKTYCWWPILCCSRLLWSSCYMCQLPRFVFFLSLSGGAFVF